MMSRGAAVSRRHSGFNQALCASDGSGESDKFVRQDSWLWGSSLKPDCALFAAEGVIELPIDFSAARSPEGFIHSGIKIVPRLSGLFKTYLKFLIGDSNLKSSRNLPLSLCGRRRCTKNNILATEPFLYLQFYIPLVSVCLETQK